MLSKGRLRFRQFCQSPKGAIRKIDGVQLVLANLRRFVRIGPSKSSGGENEPKHFSITLHRLLEMSTSEVFVGVLSAKKNAHQHESLFLAGRALW